MIDYEWRSVWKFLAWFVGILVALYIAAIIIVGVATRPNRVAAKNITQLAESKTSMKRIDKYYHLSRSVTSQAVEGVDKKNQKSYFIYLPKTKKAYYLPAKKGYSENQIKKKFEQLHPFRPIREINLGWYNGKAVWEVAFGKEDQNYGYALFNFNNAKEISYIDNL